jgi:hypothetical protein
MSWILSRTGSLSAYPTRTGPPGAVEYQASKFMGRDGKGALGASRPFLKFVERATRPKHFSLRKVSNQISFRAFGHWE